jgi:hypothetical protein
LEHPEKVFGVTFISNDQTPEVLQPGKQPLDFPPSLVSLQPTSILSRIPSVPAMWSNECNSVEPQLSCSSLKIAPNFANAGATVNGIESTLMPFAPKDLEDHY